MWLSNVSDLDDSFFLTAIWRNLPFMLFSIKSRIEEPLKRVEQLDQRLDSFERKLSTYRAINGQPFHLIEL